MAYLFYFLMFLLFLIGIMYLIVWFIKKILDNRHFDVNLITLDQKWVDQRLKDYTIDITKNEYMNFGKPITTQRGTYRVAFLNDANKKLLEVISECCDGKRFHKEFCKFTQINYPDARIKNFYQIIQTYRNYRNECVQAKFDDFLGKVAAITPQDFFEIRKRQKGDVVGVYIIYNVTKNMYYVGQAKRLFFRVNQHFTGSGNGDVYADYKYGDYFKIKIVRLSESGYDDIDLLEKNLIQKYNAFSYGYNKNNGNHY